VAGPASFTTRTTTGARTRAGLVIGVVGHIVRARALIALGIGLVFLATFLLPAVTYVLRSGPR
jgi:hypothetical protein